MKKVFEIIPAIDLIDGKCVRLTQGKYDSCKIYSDSPLDTAKSFEEYGISRLHVVDLDGAKSGSPKNLKSLEQIAANTKLKIDFGGGIKTDADINNIFSSGAAIATVGTIAVKEPDTFDKWLTVYGPGKILLGADVNNGKVAVSGWLEKSEVELIPFLIQWQSKGLTTAFCTDIQCDGMMQGPSIDLYKKIISEVPNLNVIASGGVSSIEEIIRLREAGCSGVILGKALYENLITLNDIKEQIIRCSQKE